MRRVAFLFLLCAGLAFATLVPAAQTADELIPSGVTVGGVAVGGLTSDAATAAVSNAFAQPLELDVSATKVLVGPDVLGATADVGGAVSQALASAPDTQVPLAVTVDQRLTAAFAAKLAKRLDTPATDARLLLRRARPFVTKDRPGRRLDQKGAVRVIVAALTENSRTPVALATLPVRAKLTRANFGPVIVIHRGRNLLFLYRGMRYWRSFQVATGQTAYPTPLGRFTIVVKWRNPWWYPPNSPWAKGQKPIPPGPGNPLGTRWMGLSSPGVGIHGTPQDGSIGYSVSHGCIRMHIPDAEWLFNHVNLGTTVFIVPG